MFQNINFDQNRQFLQNLSLLMNLQLVNFDYFAKSNLLKNVISNKIDNSDQN